MKYHAHIPKLLEFALNVVCDDVTLRGKQCLISPIPYPLYLRCIMTYGEKYDRYRYSAYRFYRDIRRKVKVNVQIGRLYPNVLDHVVLDDGDVDAYLITEVAHYPLVDDAAASIQRFASRCLAADKSEMMVNAISRAIGIKVPLPKPIIDVLLFYGAKLDPNHRNYFNRACIRGMKDVVKRAIENGHSVTASDVNAAISSASYDTIVWVRCTYRGIYSIVPINLLNATVETMELLLNLGVIQRGTHYEFSNIPSFSVLQWILDHDVMGHDRLLIDIASNASRYSGHYFDMLRYLVEQRNFTVPRDILVKMYSECATDLGVFDYLLLHGADVNAVDNKGKNVLECSPLLIRYWIEKDLVIKSNETNTMAMCIRLRVTAPVLEMMIDKYELNVNDDICGYTALHYACIWNRFRFVEMLIYRGADVNRRNCMGRTPYDVTSDDRIRQLLISHGCEIRRVVPLL